jgi:CubicO group peptidase (beta-lactamase class C family)
VLRGTGSRLVSRRFGVKSVGLAFAVLLSASGGRFAVADAPPRIESVDSLEIRSVEGWWLRISKDGSGRYGFGALPEHIAVAPGTFSFAQAFDRVRPLVRTGPGRLGEAHASVAYRIDGSASGLTLRLPGSRALVAELFRTARAQTRPPSSDTERRRRERIDRLWATEPPVSSRDATLEEEGAPVRERKRAVEQGLRPPVALAGKPIPGFDLRDRMAHYRVPGLSLAVINDGRVEWAEAYGVLREGEQEPVSTSTLFQAASISKPIAAFVALRLVERGSLHLDRDVNEFLLSWKLPAGEYTRERPVMLRDLLSHSGGVTVSGFPGYALGDPIPTIVDVLEGRGNTPPVRVETVPGTQYRYSGGGSTIVQLMIEDSTGQSFAAVAERLLFAPLDMDRSTALQPLPERLRHRAAAGHDARGVPIRGKWRVYPELAAAGVWSTATDIARFALGIASAYHGDNGALLGPELAQEMLTRQNDVCGLGPGVFDSEGGFWFAHSGGNAGYRAYFLLYPESGDGVAVMTNGDGGRALNFEIIRAVSAVYGWPAHKPEFHAPVALSVDSLQQWLGSYRLVDAPDAEVVRVEYSRSNLQLVRNSAGRVRTQRLVAISDNQYIVEASGVPVTFARDSGYVEMDLDGHSARRVSTPGRNGAR